jgi:predicted AlkP superfamily phosphohydrolase/phosphomutase
MINYYGDFTEKYPYNLMRAGIWLRNRYKENLNKSHISYPDPPETGIFIDTGIGKFLVRIGFWKYLSPESSMYDFTLECNKSYFRQLERWCNLIVNKPGRSYIIKAKVGKENHLLLRNSCWLKITEI